MTGNEPQWLIESRESARRLAEAFDQGIEPQPVAVNMILSAGEDCYGHMPVTVQQYTGADVEYTKKGGGYIIGGSPGGFVLGSIYSAEKFATNVVGNAARKEAARRKSMTQWRALDKGTLFMTNRRLAVQGSQQWFDIYAEHIRMADCDGVGIVLEISGWPATRLDVPAADYWFVMLQKIFYSRVVRP